MLIFMGVFACYFVLFLGNGTTSPKPEELLFICLASSYATDSKACFWDTSFFFQKKRLQHSRYDPLFWKKKHLFWKKSYIWKVVTLEGLSNFCEIGTLGAFDFHSRRKNIEKNTLDGKN